MSLSSLPLSYCTNVHPAQSLAEVIQGLSHFTAPAQERVGQRIAAGLWLPSAVTTQLTSQPAGIVELQTALQSLNLCCYTLNAFPFGNFHSERVKENVYLPDWSSAERLEYTVQCAEVLLKLMPPGTEGSLSTVPLGFKELSQPADFSTSCIHNLLQLAAKLDEFHDETGQVVRLAIEPEPLCLLETTAEAIQFFEQLFAAAESQGELEVAQRHLGLCYDVCHQAVEFEDVQQSIRDINAAGVRINKVHITCAIEIAKPGDHEAARQELAAFVEPRYLHQTFAKLSDGTVRSLTDLNQDFCSSPPAPFATAEAWRIHYHVPVHRETVGSLGTTRNDLKLALQSIAELEYAPHLEVETYTWGVLPDGQQQPSLIDGLTAELRATYDMLAALS